MTSTTAISLIKPNKKAYIVSAIFSIFLIGCNGHSTDLPDDDINNDTAKIVQVDDVININQSAELVLFYPDDNISDIVWQQTSGDEVTLLTSTSKVIAFTPVSAGEYSFTVSFSLNQENNQSLTHTISVQSESHKINTKVAHAVLSGNNVSLRTFIDNSLDTSSITWQQISGPNIDFSQDNVEGELSVFFTAPDVEKDTLLTFQTAVNDADTSYTDNVVILVEPAAPIASNAYFDDRVANVFPYNSTSPYADSIVGCVYSNTLSSSCTLSTLPLLAANSEALSINDIMDRLVVSHEWMGDRFLDFLVENDDNDDFKNLLRATTAIVISYDVRPSFYWAATGAIYLDPDNFWLTPDERDTINEAPDFRSDFGKELQFVMPWRYVKDNDYADNYFPIDSRTTRTSSDGFYRLASLLYHELAHANDFFPSTEWFTHDDTSRVLDAAVSTNFESDGLAVIYPLQSSEMRALASVSFSGESATPDQKNYTPSDIETFFSPDRATGYYAYSSEREDYALLFEELMMQSRFNVFRDVAITNLPTGDDIFASDYIVTWGQRGRIGEEEIKERVLYSAERVLPEFNSVDALAEVPTPIMMTPGDNWIENLSISPIVDDAKGLVRGKKISNLEVQLDNTNRPLPDVYYHKDLPKE